MYCFASHGMSKDGRQVVLLNEFDNKKKFYKIAPAEIEIRNMASKFSNSFHFCSFACCREVYIGAIHTGGVSKE